MDAAGLSRAMRIDIGALAGALHAERARAALCIGAAFNSAHRRSSAVPSTSTPMRRLTCLIQLPPGYGSHPDTPRVYGARAAGVRCRLLIFLAFSIKNLCERCDAVCCRLTVLVDPTDRIPHHLTSVTPEGWHVMARDEEGWCVAIDAARMCCSIYETRPAICRRFVMSGPYCRDVRATYDDQRRRGIPLTLYNA